MSRTASPGVFALIREAFAAFLRRHPSAARQAEIAPVFVRHAGALAHLHATGFARPWDAMTFQSLLSERAVLADGLFARPDGEPHGFALSRIAADEAELLTIVVEPRRCGRGAGTRLLARHIDNLAGRGVKALFLEVDENNAPARRVYQRHGFREVGRRPSYYRRADGSAANALVLRADIG